MARLFLSSLLQRSKDAILRLHDNDKHVPTLEQVMIPPVPYPQHTVWTTGGRVSALVQDMLRAWIDHHQRLADLGISRFL